MRTQNKIHTILIIFVFTTLLLIVFLVYPTLKSIKNGSEEILSDRSRDVFINSEIREVDNFKKKYKDYKSNLEKIDKLLVDSKNPVDFIEFLEKIASDFNVITDINFVPSKEKDANNGSLVIFQISAKGDFLNILRFIEKLETGPYLIEIQNLTIKKSEKEIDKEKNISNRIDANFLIEVTTK